MTFASVFVKYTAVIFFICLAEWIIREVGYCAVFKKAGRAGWTAFVPIYADIKKAEIGGHAVYYLFQLIAGGAAALFLYCSDALSYQISLMQVTMLTLGYICLIIAFVIWAAIRYLLARSFGHGAGYTLGLVFFPTVFALILGFGKSQYISFSKEQGT